MIASLLLACVLWDCTYVHTATGAYKQVTHQTANPTPWEDEWNAWRVLGGGWICIGVQRVDDREEARRRVAALLERKRHELEQLKRQTDVLEKQIADLAQGQDDE